MVIVIGCHSNKFSYRGLASRELCAIVRNAKHTWLNFNMADDNGETNELSSLALDSNKQKEFEDKVKRIRAQVSTKLCSVFNKKYLANVLTPVPGLAYVKKF